MKRILSLSSSHTHVPFLIAAAAYAAVTAAILLASLHAADGHFIYPLDDTYINMAMAKNFASHGVWGISPYQFSSSTSSPLYVLVLSTIYRFVGPSQYVPLVLACGFGLASIYVAAQIVSDYLSKTWQQTVILVVAILLTPLFVLGVLGMEHSLHLLLTLLFLQRFEREGESPWVIAAITALMVAARYEGLFMAAVAFAIFAAQRKWSRAAIIAVAAWVPVCGYALFSISHGGYWLPNSVAIKGLRTHGLSMRGQILNRLAITVTNSILGIHLLLLLTGIVITAFALRKIQPRLAIMLCLVAGAGYLHLVMADIGWVFRYEDYLIAAGILAVGCALPSFPQFSRVAAISASFLFFCAAAFLMGRALTAGVSLPQYSRAIYLQQWQMAGFLHAYYPQAAVAANDIGAINFRNNLHCIDLVGLANSDIFAARRTGSYSTQFLDRETASHDVKVAMIYDSWFSPQSKVLFSGPAVPASWIRVGRWRIPQQQQLGSDTVSFYALTPDQVSLLAAHFHEFKSVLPSEVTATSGSM